MGVDQIWTIFQILPRGVLLTYCFYWWAVQESNLRPAD